MNKHRSFRFFEALRSMTFMNSFPIVIPCIIVTKLNSQPRKNPHFSLLDKKSSDCYKAKLAMNRDYKRVVWTNEVTFDYHIVIP